MSDLPLYIGIGMILVGLALGIYMTIKILEEKRRNGDNPLDSAHA